MAGMNGPRQTAGNARVVAARAFAGGHHARGRARGLAVRPCGHHARATPAAAAPPCGDNDPVSAVVSSGKDVRGVVARGCEEHSRGGEVRAGRATEAADTTTRRVAEKINTHMCRANIINNSVIIYKYM